MQNFTLHTHTIGFDGRNTIEEMAKVAQEKGFTSLGISNHFIVHPNIKQAQAYPYAAKLGYQNIYSSSFDEAVEKFEKHYAEIDEVQSKADIQIFKGMEADFFMYPEWEDGFFKATSYLKPDYIIGSVHFVENGDRLLNMHDLKRAGEEEQKQLLHSYWDKVRKSAQSGMFNALAHLDLPKKSGLGLKQDWLVEEQRTAYWLGMCGSIVEINTGFFRKDNFEPYPGCRMLPEFQWTGVRFFFSDDAHSTDQIGRHFDDAKKIADKANITLYCEPEKKSRHFFKNVIPNGMRQRD